MISFMILIIVLKLLIKLYKTAPSLFL